jgi:CheY-like chemotaxis protein
LDGWDQIKLLSVDGELKEVPIIVVTARSSALDALNRMEHRLWSTGSRCASWTWSPSRSRSPTWWRRSSTHSSDAAPREAHRSSQRGGSAAAGAIATLLVQSHEVYKDGEFRLLYRLALNEGPAMPYSWLVEYAWGYFNEDSSALLKSHASHLRKKPHMPAKGNGAITAVIRGRVQPDSRLTGGSSTSPSAHH